MVGGAAAGSLFAEGGIVRPQTLVLLQSEHVLSRSTKYETVSKYAVVVQNGKILNNAACLYSTLYLSHRRQLRKSVDKQVFVVVFEEGALPEEWVHECILLGAVRQ